MKSFSRQREAKSTLYVIRWIEAQNILFYIQNLYASGMLPVPTIVCIVSRLTPTWCGRHSVISGVDDHG